MAQVKIIWTKEAYGDFEEIVGYIQKDSIHYAAAIGQQIILTVESLAIFPGSGREVPEYRNKNLREKIFQNYRIVYRRVKQKVEIIAIIHSARSIEDIL